MRKIPILYIVDKMEMGGTQRHLSLLMCSMAARGFEPYLCCLSRAGVMATELDQDRIISLEVDRISDLNALKTMPRLIRFMREKKIKIAHSYLFSANLYGNVAAWLAGVPIRLSSRRGSPYGGRWYHFCALRCSNLLVDAVIVNSEDLLGFVSESEALTQQKIIKIYNGVKSFDLDAGVRQSMREEFGIADDHVVIGFLSRFHPIKDHMTALRAAVSLCQRYNKLRFLFVGDGQTQQAVQEFANAQGIGEYCIFAGARTDVPKITQAFDVGILCSTDEGFPNAVLEMMTAANPVIATNISGNKEVILDGKTGYLFAVGDDLALAEHLSRLIDDASLRFELGQAARQHVLESYSLDTMLDSMTKMYHDLLHIKSVEF